MRYKAVTCMCRSYRPTVPVSYVSQVLGFSTAMAANGASDENDAAAALEECLEWLKAHGASTITDNNGDMLLDTKVCLISTLYIRYPVVVNLIQILFPSRDTQQCKVIAVKSFLVTRQL